MNEFGDELASDIVKVPHHGSGELFDEFPENVSAERAFVSSTGTNQTFMHPRKRALDLYDAHGTIFCTCDEARTRFHITATVSEVGGITVAPDQPPYLVWERDSNDVLQNVIVTP